MVGIKSPHELSLPCPPCDQAAPGLSAANTQNRAAQGRDIKEISCMRRMCGSSLCGCVTGVAYIFLQYIFFKGTLTDRFMCSQFNEKNAVEEKVSVGLFHKKGIAGSSLRYQGRDKKR